MTKKEQINKAQETYSALYKKAGGTFDAIREPAWEAYHSELIRIETEEQDDEEDIIEVDGKRYRLID